MDPEGCHSSDIQFLYDFHPILLFFYYDVPSGSANVIVKSQVDFMEESCFFPLFADHPLPTCSGFCLRQSRVDLNVCHCFLVLKDSQSKHLHVPLQNACSAHLQRALKSFQILFS